MQAVGAYASYAVDVPGAHILSWKGHRARATTTALAAQGCKRWPRLCSVSLNFVATAGVAAVAKRCFGLVRRQHSRQRLYVRCATAQAVAAPAASVSDPWVAPVVVAQAADGDVQVALGALERLDTSQEWLHCFVLDEAESQWRPTLLLRKGLDSWESDKLSFRLGLQSMVEKAFPLANGASLAELAPAWPGSVVNALTNWPLKGPGMVVMDPQFFMQRSAITALRSNAGPVLFPGAARWLRLSSEQLVKATTDCIRGRNLREMLVDDTQDIRFGQLLGQIPQSIANGHFDLARASQQEHHGRGDLVKVELKEEVTGLQCEPRSWTCGAVIRTVLPGSEAEQVGCRVGDIIRTVGGTDVSSTPLEEVDRLLHMRPPVRLALERPQLSDHLYLRETPAEDEAVEVFAGVGESAKKLIPEIADRIGGKHLFISERTPMLFAGDGGTASHVHIDNKPLVQFCHVVHGTKFFGVAPDAPWVSPDGSSDKQHSEVSLNVDVPLSEEAKTWMERPDVSIAALRPGDLMMFQGRKPHFGANGLGDICVALFHGARPVADMIRGDFGPVFQELALRQVQSER